MSAESLQKILRTLADPTRVRILSLLEREELAVQELMEVLGMAQSRVSRHLGILREAGLLRDRREGTYVFYRFAAPADGAWHDAWALARRELAGDPAGERDGAALARVLDARAHRARSFFDAVGPEWDALRKVFNDDVLRARALAHLAPPGWTVADVGTGTGILAIELARLGLDVVAIDHSPRMLEAARAKLLEEGFAAEEEGYAAPDGGRVTLRPGEAGALPLADASVDAALAHMVLHYLPAPADALREMARVVRPGGAVVVVDFVRHEAEWMRDELGVQWLGFPPDEVAGWLRDVGLERPRVETIAARSPGRDLPAAFIASARRPSSADAQ
jgi:ubiquinone/menaquinone biosynthesis C-methylase UbiE/DNA-binding transcriptional ArsR family regulator